MCALWPFKDSQALILLLALTCNLGKCLGRLARTRSVKHLLLATPRVKLVKAGAKVAQHAKQVTFEIAEVEVSRELIADILDRIRRLGVLPTFVQRCCRGDLTRCWGMGRAEPDALGEPSATLPRRPLE